MATVAEFQRVPVLPIAAVLRLIRGQAVSMARASILTPTASSTPMAAPQLQRVTSLEQISARFFQDVQPAHGSEPHACHSGCAPNCDLKHQCTKHCALDCQFKHVCIPNSCDFYVSPLNSDYFICKKSYLGVDGRLKVHVCTLAACTHRKTERGIYTCTLTGKHLGVVQRHFEKMTGAGGVITIETSETFQRQRESRHKRDSDQMASDISSLCKSTLENLLWSKQDPQPKRVKVIAPPPTDGSSNEETLRKMLTEWFHDECTNMLRLHQKQKASESETAPQPRILACALLFRITILAQTKQCAGQQISPLEKYLLQYLPPAEVCASIVKCSTKQLSYAQRYLSNLLN